MNDIHNKERGEQAVRWLAIVGFVVLVFVLAYLAVQAVRYLPTAFSSLANVFESNQRDLRERTEDPDDENPVVVVENDDDEEVIDDEDDNEYEEPVSTATSTPPQTTEPVATTTTSSPSTPTPAPVQYRTVVTYKTPVSDPNGTTDLEATFVTVGQMSTGQKFVPTGYLKEDDQNAAQFKVKNIGTKTSTNWNFTLKLPDGQTFNSKTQLPLKPGEMSTLTIVFGLDKKSGNQQLDFSVTGGNDANLSNNAFRTNVSVK